MESQSKRRSLVWGGYFVLFGLALLVQLFVELGPWVWTLILAAAGLGAFVVYRTDRADVALLIATYVMWVIALMVLLVTINVLQDGFIAFYALAAIALPFLRVYLRDRSERWPLIPFYVLLAIGVMVVLLDLDVLDDNLVPAYVMFVIAIPFYVVYSRDRTQWWPLIPAGIMTVIGLSFLLAGGGFQTILALVLVVVGVGILVRALRQRRVDGPAASELYHDGPPPE